MVESQEGAEGLHPAHLPPLRLQLPGQLHRSLPCPSSRFTDVDTSRWYHEGVDFVVAKELMNGMTDTLFQPDGTLTRGQLMTILYRMAGTPETEAATPFTDVASGRYFTDAVAWAYEAGIAEGVSGTTFAPNAPVTREQLVTFLYRYAKYQEEDVSAQGNLAGYPDAEAVSEYAQIPMAWAVEQELVNGIDGKLAPKGRRHPGTNRHHHPALLRHLRRISEPQAPGPRPWGLFHAMTRKVALYHSTKTQKKKCSSGTTDIPP